MKDRQMDCFSDTKPQAKYQCQDRKGLSQMNSQDPSRSQTLTNEYVVICVETLIFEHES